MLTPPLRTVTWTDEVRTWWGLGLVKRERVGCVVIPPWISPEGVNEFRRLLLATGSKSARMDVVE